MFALGAENVGSNPTTLIGWMVEWFKTSILKIDINLFIVGSNPTSST